MKKMQISAAVLSLLCAAALTACGSDPITADSTAETTAVAETTAETEAETTAAESATTAATTTADAESETTTSAEDETTATAEETTTAAEEQTTAATEAQTEAQTTEAPKTEKSFFDEIKIGGSIAEYSAAHQNEMRESDSCLVNGKDRTYSFPNAADPDYEIRTVVENGNERIVEIDLKHEGIATREGIQVGSTREEVTNAYGNEAMVDYFTKTNADGKVEVFVEHGIVIEIVVTAS